MEFLRTGVAGEQIEKLGEILPECISTCEKTDIAVDAGRAHVVVTGRQMAVASNSLGLLTHDETD